MTTLAIDIGGTKLAAALIGADGQIRDRRELPTPASQTPQALRDALSALVSPLQAHAQRVAIASTGIIRDGSLLALNPHNLGGLLHFPLVKTLEQLTNLPTIAINDAQAAAWAEYQALDGDITDIVFITVSTGVGSRILLPREICAVQVPSPLSVQPDAVEPAAAAPDNDGASGLRPVTGLSLASFAVQIAVTVPPTTGLSGFRVMDECAASSGPATNFSVCCNVPS